MSTVSDYFGCLVFDDRVMKATLSDDVYRSLKKTIDEGATLQTDVANAVAVAMKWRYPLHALVPTFNRSHR